MLAHLDAPRPSPRDLRRDLPREFDEVVHRAMATDPSERYPSAGDLGQAALVAAGERRQANAWSVVATGEAAPAPAPVHDERVPQAVPADAPRAGVAEPAQAGRPDPVRWAIALAVLVIVAIGMVSALNGISTL
jgi:serine/threonine-protein kinase